MQLNCVDCSIILLESPHTEEPVCKRCLLQRNWKVSLLKKNYYKYGSQTATTPGEKHGHLLPTDTSGSNGSGGERSHPDDSSHTDTAETDGLIFRSLSVKSKEHDEIIDSTSTEHVLLLNTNHIALKERVLSMEKTHQGLQTECKQLKADSDTIMTKINQVGALLPSLRDSLKVGDTMHFKLGQLVTVLTDISAVPIGGSVTLELSKKIGQGQHFLIVNNVTFKLEWKYGKNSIEMQLLLSKPEAIPATLSCEFRAEIESNEDTAETTATKATAIRQLAVVCCGKSEIHNERAKSTIRKPVGHEKVVMIHSDVSLVLCVREHKRKAWPLLKRASDVAIAIEDSQSSQDTCVHCRHSTAPPSSLTRPQKREKKETGTFR